MKRRLPLVIVSWNDASTSAGWTELQEIRHSTVSVQTVGWLYHQDEKTLVLFSSFTSDQAAGEVTVIPVPWVQSVKRLRGNGVVVMEDK